MSKAQKRPPWHVKVVKNLEVLAEFDVPAHKMERHEIANFLRALVIRYRTDGPESMVQYYVNGRRGQPTRLPFADVERAWSPDETKEGFLCGNSDCYASALQPVDPAVAEIRDFYRAQNRAAAASER